MKNSISQDYYVKGNEEKIFKLFSDQFPDRRNIKNRFTFYLIDLCDLSSCSFQPMMLCGYFQFCEWLIHKIDPLKISICTYRLVRFLQATKKTFLFTFWSEMIYKKLLRCCCSTCDKREGFDSAGKIITSKPSRCRVSSFVRQNVKNK